MTRLFLLLLTLCTLEATAQQATLVLKITSDVGQPLPGATVELLRNNNSLVKVQMTDTMGRVQFTGLQATDYKVSVSRVGYAPLSQTIAPSNNPSTLVLQPTDRSMDGVTVTARKPFVELQAGKTVVNMDASISNTGNTVLEALEKMPGVTVDKDGNISLKGRSGVTVMIDGKLTYLGGSELANLLNGMSASSVSQVELMEQPPARYDAAGNAGVINIRTKKNRQKGFNGTATVNYGQGEYAKFGNSLQLNYRSGDVNLFLNYSNNLNRNFMRVYALRKYYKNDGTVISLLEQPSFTSMGVQAHNLRTGIDYTLNKKSSLGLTFTGTHMNRDNESANTALWMNPQGVKDSTILTNNTSDLKWQNAGATLSFRHTFNPRRELTADVDALGYRTTNDQTFTNRFSGPAGYVEQTKAAIPTEINIYSAKVDYSEQLRQWKLESGVKISRIQTDNMADFQVFDTSWKPDYGKTNHFLYTENIQAAYVSAQTEWKKWTVLGGLRYEHTNYDARQLGNVMVKDSAFSRAYNSLFPNLSLSFAADSINTFSISAGRRIDRPGFQKLNPFIVIINKYTQHRGNPYFRPQYTWNTELSHSYKNVLLTSLSYSVTTDYFSQIFPVDTTGLVIYTEGNLGKLQVLGLSIGTQLSPARWWSLSAQAVINRRIMEGVITTLYKAAITQYNINLNNQFRFSKGWGAELTGFYSSRARNDIQEIVDPAGQLTIGLSKSVWQNKGTLRLAMRDIFYTQWMKGNTEFTNITEYFKLTRDTRVATISFTYRFGKAYKTSKRSSGAAGEEIQRVGQG